MPPASPRRTSDVSLTAWPSSVARPETVPASGQSARSVTSSTRRVSPAPTISSRIPCALDRADHASQPGPFPRRPVPTTRRTAYRPTRPASPPTWSSWGCVMTTRSIRRSQGETRASSRATSRSGSGPPSTSARAPRLPVTRMASPCPTSRISTRGCPSGRRAAPTPSPAIATASAATTRRRRRRSGRPGVGDESRVLRGRVAALPGSDDAVTRRKAPDRAVAAPAAPGRRRRMSRTAIRRPRAVPATSRSRAASAARTASHGALTVTLANGTRAPTDAMAMIDPRVIHAGSPATAATAAGNPRVVDAPPRSATAPAAIDGATIGATARFTMGDTIETRPKPMSTSGSVAACAASETPIVSAIGPGMRPPQRRPTRSVMAVPQTMSPAVAADESRKPWSFTAPGSARSIVVTAQARAARAAVARPRSRAMRTVAAMRAARTTGGEAPTSATYAQTAARVASIRGRRPSPRRTIPSAAMTIAMFHPEIATTWLRPVATKSAVTGLGTRSRIPSRIPAARPAAGSGTASRKDASAPARSAASEAPGPASGEARPRARISSDPAIPRATSDRPYPSSPGGRARPENAIRVPAPTSGYRGARASSRTGG